MKLGNEMRSENRSAKGKQGKTKAKHPDSAGPPRICDYAAVYAYREKRRVLFSQHIDSSLMCVVFCVLRFVNFCYIGCHPVTGLANMLPSQRVFSLGPHGSLLEDGELDTLALRECDGGLVALANDEDVARPCGESLACRVLNVSNLVATNVLLTLD